jgi:aryl-alcohol dehydrogenase-like predicted oxidoreductase
MDKAFDNGVFFFDTANAYPLGSTPETIGRTEEYIGRWLRGRREQIILATKFGLPMSSSPNNQGGSREHIMRSIEGSLRRLQTDYIDLYQMHHVDRSTPWDEIWEAMEVLRYQGKILYVGSSNFAGWHLAKAQEAAGRRNLLGLVSEQSLYNLLARDIELEVIPAAVDYGLGIIPWSPLQGGLLGGVVGKEREGRRRGTERSQRTIDAHRPQLEEYEAYCDDLGEEPGTVALAWLLTRPGVTGPIVGPRTMDQLEGALRALEVTLSTEALDRLDHIFPGHRPAPEDYAW